MLSLTDRPGFLTYSFLADSNYDVGSDNYYRGLLDKVNIKTYHYLNFFQCVLQIVYDVCKKL